MQHQILINVIIFVAYVLNLPLNTQRSHSRSQGAGKWSLILAHDRRPIYRAPTYIAVPLLGPHQPRCIGLTLYIYIYIIHMVHYGSLRRNIPHILRNICNMMSWYPTTFWHELWKSKPRLQNRSNIRIKPSLFHIEYQITLLHGYLFHKCCQYIVFDTEAW